jgi:dihydrofolate reductase
MGKVISSISVTPDGFCGHIEGIADEEHHQFAIDLLKKADVLLLGRLTYQIFERYWPFAVKDSTLSKPMLELAVSLDRINKVVASKTLTKADWKNSVILQNVNVDTISTLKEPNKNVLIFGSPGLLSSMTKQGLIDEYYFTIHPMIAGNGKRLFEELKLGKRIDLKYRKTKKFRSGVLTICYSKTNGAV